MKISYKKQRFTKFTHSKNKNYGHRVFKILSEMGPPVLSNLVQKRSSSYNFRYTNILQVPSVKSSHFGKSPFKYAAAVLWNSIPDDFRKCSNSNQFKGLIRSWNGKKLQLCSL